MQIKQIVTSALVFLMILLIVMSVQALGVTPARKIVDYDNGLDYSGQFTVKNVGGNPTTVTVDLSGDLVRYVSVDKVLINFNKGETEKTVNYHAQIPNDVGKPGDNDITFVLTEIPFGAESGTYLGARLSLSTALRVRIPHPGKYVDASLSVLDGDAGGNVILIVPIYNLGTDALQDVHAVIEVKGPTNELVEVLETTSVLLKAGERKELRVVWNAQVNPGNYYGNVVVYYDNEIAETGGAFSVGGTKIDLRSIEVSSFELGGIAKFEILVRNLWNEDVNDVRAEVLIYNLNGDLIGTLKTANEELKANSDGVLLGYWDTKGVEVGEYKTKIFLSYGDKTIERDVETVIKPDGIKATVRSTGRAVALSGLDYTFNSVFMIGLVVLIIINICWFVYFSRRKNKG